MLNPYNVGNWVKRPHFYGRTELVGELMRDDQRCTYLMGIRRIGKTSMLRYIENLPGSDAGLFLNLQSCARGAEGKLDSASVARLIKNELRRKARSSSDLA